MKFTDGNWLHRKGVTPHYAAEVYQHRVEGARVELVVPCHPIRQRGDTLAGPVLTVTLHSPAEGVIGVKIEHFRGAAHRGPDFELRSDGPHGQVQVDQESVTLRSGELSARVPRSGGWRIDFADARGPLTSSLPRSTALMQVEGMGDSLQDMLSLGVGELVYGLGERFTAFTKNGQSINIWNEDGGTNSDQAYKNVPFYLTNRGYGVLVNHPGRVSFEVATERTNRVGFSVPGQSLEYFVFAGPTPKEVLRRYTGLTGRPALPPPWSFGLWLSTSFTTDYDEATVNSFIEGMAERGIPLSVFHYDCFWMRGMHWCDFEWDPEVFPDPEGMLRRLHERGLKVCVWINPYIAQASSLFADAAANGYLLHRPNGDVWQWDMWQPGMGIVDFSNPEAKRWYQGHLERLIDMGVDALKTDFGERIPTDVRYWDGSEPHRAHNHYALAYNQAVWEVLERKRGAGQAVLFARSATVGGQQYPVHWGGDCWSTFEAMAESLRGGLSLGMCGFGFWSHDIGGFEGMPPAELYHRWVAFGLLSSHSRLHGSTSYRVPWQVDDLAVDVLRHFTRLKLMLMPYLWSKAVEAHHTGVPMMRAMHLEFPDDPACDGLDRQYMLGDALLVAPVFCASGEVSFYVPAGVWTDIQSGERLQGPGWRRGVYGPLELPVLARPGSVIPVGPGDPDGDGREGLTLHAYEVGPEGVAVEVWVPGESTPIQLHVRPGDTQVGGAEPAIRVVHSMPIEPVDTRA